MTLRDELYQRLADQLSADIFSEMFETGLRPPEIVDRVVPRGTPGSQFHRPFLAERLEMLFGSLGKDSLDLVTCLQIAEAFGWPIGLLEDET